LPWGFVCAINDFVCLGFIIHWLFEICVIVKGMGRVIRIAVYKVIEIGFGGIGG
jgi:hypothetical protein